MEYGWQLTGKWPESRVGKGWGWSQKVGCGEGNLYVQLTSPEGGCRCRKMA